MRELPHKDYNFKNMRKFLRDIFCLSLFIFLHHQANANDLVISNVALKNQVSTGTANIQFDISWKNSWRYVNDNSDSTKDFRDAIWVFAKYYDTSDATKTWKPVKFDTTGGFVPNYSSVPPKYVPTNFSASDGTPGDTSLEIGIPSENIGVFIQRNPTAIGGGDFTSHGVQLVWNWGADDTAHGGTLTSNSNVVIRVYTIEMVFVPGGSFWVGAGTDKQVSTFYNGASFPNAVQITAQPLQSTSGITFDAGTASFQSPNSGSPQSNYQAVPTGFLPFYIMKYEISQGAYAEFLNTLNRTQQAQRIVLGSNPITSVNTSGKYVLNGTSTPSGSPTNRNYIRAQSSTGSYSNGTTTTAITSFPASGPIIFGVDFDNDGNLSEVDGSGKAIDGQAIACNFLNWMDLAAYLDWAGLRPMTEFEFEKAARGPNPPYLYEYAWGSPKIKAPGSIKAGTTARFDEATDTTGEDGHCNYNPGPGPTGPMGGPLRSGFTGGTSFSRLQAGASYYGVLDLSGNVAELVVSVGDSNGVIFTNVNGNGALSSNGYADTSTWPGLQTGEVKTATGSGLRGGSWNDIVNTQTNKKPYSNLQTSDRNLADYSATSRDKTYGGRGLRNWP